MAVATTVAVAAAVAVAVPATAAAVLVVVVVVVATLLHPGFSKSFKGREGVHGSDGVPWHLVTDSPKPLKP